MTSYIAPGLFDVADRRPWPFSPLEPQSYGLIMADPPWHFVLRSEAGEEKSPQAQYDTMSLAEIAALPVADLATEDCVLWLWGTQAGLDDQMQILMGWGFKFCSAGGWDKGRWGTGYVWRSVMEFVLIGTRGAPRFNGASIPNLLDEKATGHSCKPGQAYDYAERMVPNVRRVSLFERPVRPGWDGWGNQYGQPIERKPKKVKDVPPLLVALGDGT